MSEESKKYMEELVEKNKKLKEHFKNLERELET